MLDYIYWTRIAKKKHLLIQTRKPHTPIYGRAHLCVHHPHHCPHTNLGYILFRRQLARAYVHKKRGLTIMHILPISQAWASLLQCDIFYYNQVSIPHVNIDYLRLHIFVLHLELQHSMVRFLNIDSSWSILHTLCESVSLLVLYAILDLQG